jgi:3'-phosphoadenosine 5'-phosphosulfate synthase
MPVWNYAPVPTDEGGAGTASRLEAGSSQRISNSSSGSAARLPPYRRNSRGDANDDDESDSMMTRRMPYCLGMLVLLAIIYVLSRTETGNVQQCSPVLAAGGAAAGAAEFDIGAYRRDKLSKTAPHIIECAAAGEGGSQAACHLPRSKRYAALGQKGATLWMTGLSGSGKSTIATALEEALVLLQGKHVYRLDGDNIRTGLNRDLDFTDADRAESVRRVGEMACLFSDSGTITIVSLVSPFRADRDAVRARHSEQNIPFLEVFMDVPLDVVRSRDPKGLYKQVDAGKLKGFTGVDAPYEPPLAAEVRLPNSEMTVEQCVAALLRALTAEGILSAGAADPAGLPLPDGDEVIDLHVPSTLRAERTAEAALLPRVLLTDIDLNWLQTVGEGWASPLRGFMREGTLLQTLHFGSYLADPHNVTGQYDFNEQPTDFGMYTVSHACMQLILHCYSMCSGMWYVCIDN